MSSVNSRSSCAEDARLRRLAASSCSTPSATAAQQIRTTRPKAAFMTFSQVVDGSFKRLLLPPGEMHDRGHAERKQVRARECLLVRDFENFVSEKPTSKCEDGYPISAEKTNVGLWAGR